MAKRSTDLLRNLGIVAHIDAGKTTLTERFLFFAGVEHKLGEVDDGTTVMDWMDQERERGITIVAAATSLPWAGHRLNLIDTPGHVDFTIEVERCMRVLDGAVLVIDAVAGVQAQSETVWRQMRRHRVPAIAFVNKCDRPGADYLAASASLRRRLDAPSIPIQYPFEVSALPEGAVPSDADLAPLGVVDLLTSRALVFFAEPVAGGVEPIEVPVPAAVADEVGVLRAELIDTLAEEDDELMARVLEDEEPPLEQLKGALRRRTLEASLVPVLCGSALRNVGVQPVMDAVVDYLPAPTDVPPIAGTVPAGPAGHGGPVVSGGPGGPAEPLERLPVADAPLTALAFKVMADTHGDLVFVRVYAGVLRAGDQVLNPRTNKRERVNRLVRMHAEERESIEEAGPGEIVAVTGLKTTTTGDTLCSLEEPILLEPLAFPEPVITMVVEPRSTADRDKLRAALGRLAHEDPSFHEREDEQTGQWYVSGMGELHLEVVLQRLATEFRVEANMGKPRVAYREAPRTVGRGAGRVERTLGGKEVFGAVEVEIRPRARTPLAEPGGSDAVSVTFEPGCGLPQAFVEPVTGALRDAAQVGPRFGYPLVHAEVRVVGSESNPRIDAELGFVQAAAQALRAATARAEIELLEPVMRFEIQTPEDFSSVIMADLNARRADVDSVVVEERLQSIKGSVPLAQMFGYATAVRSLSQGRAGYSMRPAGFRPVPEDELEARGLVWV